MGWINFLIIYPKPSVCQMFQLLSLIKIKEIFIHKRNAIGHFRLLEKDLFLKSVIHCLLTEFIQLQYL